MRRVSARTPRSTQRGAQSGARPKSP
jgi:hypothetical protein